MKLKYFFLLALASASILVVPVSLDMSFDNLLFAIICFLLALTALICYFALLFRKKKGLLFWGAGFAVIILFGVYYYYFRELKCQYVFYKYREEMEELIKLSKSCEEEILHTFEYDAADVGEHEIELKGKLKTSSIANNPFAHIWILKKEKKGDILFIVNSEWYDDSYGIVHIENAENEKTLFYDKYGYQYKKIEGNWYLFQPYSSTFFITFY